MDILDQSFGVETAPVELDDLIVRTELPAMPPQGAIRNRAATTALLTSDPTKAVENYNLMMVEGEQGKDDTLQQIQAGIQEQTKQMDMKGVISVLGDKNVSLEQKRGAIEALKNSQFLKDSGTILHTNALAQASKGETVEAEDARLSTADAVRNVYKARQEIQGLVNAHAASLDSADASTAVGMAEAWVMPFGDLVSAGKVARGTNKNMSLWDTVKSFIAPGTSTADIRNKLANTPPEKRVKLAQAVLDSIKQNSGAIMNDNQFAQFDRATKIFGEGGYTSVDEWLDNISPLLDVIGVGVAMRGGAKVAKATKKAESAAQSPEFTSKARRPGSNKQTVDDVDFEEIHRAEWDLVGDPYNPNQIGPIRDKIGYTPDIEDQVRRIEMNVAKRENPASPGAIVAQANPERARAMHNLVVSSATDEIAEGLYGVTREQAIVNDTFPTVATESGAVTSKAPDIDRALRARLAEESGSGAIYFTPRERAAALDAKASKFNEFAHAEGLTLISDAQSSFRLDGDKIVVSADFGTPEGAFLRAEDAIEQAKYALRGQGIVDEDIVLLKKDGLDYVPVSLDEVKGVDGSYLVRIQTKLDYDVNDIGKLDEFDVKRNIFDSIPTFVWDQKGSVSRWLSDAASMLHPVYTSAASVASDGTAKFEKLLLGMASEYADQFVKFDKTRKAKIDDYIREANYNGIAFDVGDLTARGFKPAEIKSLKSWRDFWDVHFYLENHDLVKTLNQQGYQLFKNGQDELYAKPLSKDTTINRVYDPALGDVDKWEKGAHDMLYASGGFIAKLRRPTSFNGNTVEHMVVRNTPNEYLRKFRDTDTVLNYRPGYFQIQYNAPRFVEEVLRGPGGEEIGRKAVAVAGDTAEAGHFAKRMAASQGRPISDFNVRGDDRALRRDSNEYWDLQGASGRIAQRHRGQLLEDSAGLNHLGDGSYILNPVDSAQRAARSIAGRTVSRNMLEAAKARFIQQYGNMLAPDGVGGKHFPKNVGEITKKGDKTGKEIRDARTTYEYIRYLEDGYINSADEAFKQFMNWMGNVAGSFGLSKAERAAMQVADVGPTSVAKNSVFTAYIGTNFMRQWIVQPHQVLRTMAYNPQAWATLQMQKLPIEFVSYKLGLSPASDFAKFVDGSGMLDAVDKSNLVRGALTDAADSTNRAWKAVGRANAIPRKVGFDTGEQANLLGHLAAVFDSYKRRGLNLSDKSIRDEAYAEARALSYEMNFAGDMPYNQTTPAVLLQFMQVPHKAALQLTNRKLSPAIRARMFAADIVMFGPPTILVADLLGADILPEDPNQREIFTYGVLSWAYNKMFSELSGEKQSIDFSSLAPYELEGWRKFIVDGLLGMDGEGGYMNLITNSPAGQLWLKDSGRIQNAIGSVGRYFNAFEDFDEDKQTFLEVLNEVSKISSGWNNAYKAALLYDGRKRFDQYGNALEQDVTKLEAVSQAFGFGSADVRDTYRISKQMSGDVKKHREEVLKVYEDIKRYYYQKLEVENSDPAFVQKVTGRVLKLFEHDVVAQSIIAGRLRQDLKGKDQALVDLFIKRANIPDTGNLRDQVLRMPESPNKAKMLEYIKQMEEYREGTK